MDASYLLELLKEVQGELRSLEIAFPIMSVIACFALMLSLILIVERKF